MDAILLVAMTEKYKKDITTIDGKLTFVNGYIWKSNTEPIKNIYWSTFTAQADTLALRIIDEIKKVAGI
jgi:phosphomannomutase